MSRDERREQILDAATAAFAAGGYAGTSTDQVARAAGVSQPYVVRMFGTKHELFAEVFDRIGRRIVAAFSAVPAGPAAGDELGAAYVRLLGDRNLLLVLMHGFAAARTRTSGALASGHGRGLRGLPGPHGRHARPGAGLPRPGHAAQHVARDRRP
ncbi:TetR/AcrR family transcriptional regulator [Oerskovia sp. M15]